MGGYLVKNVLTFNDDNDFNPSKNESVQSLLEEFKAHNRQIYTNVQTLREIVFLNDSNTSERIIYGGIMFTGKADWGGVYVSKNHISFEFSEGHSFSDPDKLLEGTGKKRRHLKIKNVSDIKDKKVGFYVLQAISLSNT